ncbi:MAG: helix-turn-helix transcriptional regulator [Erysipelotrichales bacterium]|nr:helix-turn-helix transcriptional regulator [Erysipelotrichales bacterium]
MENLKITIGKNIQELRKSNNLTQNELAAKLNYTPKAISKWERGESIPELETLISISKIFNVTVDYLLSDSHDKNINHYMNKETVDKNKYFFTAFLVSVIWTLATIIFVYASQYLQVYPYQVFIWSVPVSLLLISFQLRKEANITRTIIFSTFLWTLIAAIYFQFIKLNIYLIFIVGVPAQIAIFLWSKIIRIK